MHSKYLNKFREKAQKLPSLWPDDRDELAQLWEAEYVELVELVMRDSSVAAGHLAWILKTAVEIHDREKGRFADYISFIDSDYYRKVKVGFMQEHRRQLYDKRRQAYIDVIVGLSDAIGYVLEMVVTYYPQSRSKPRVQELVRRYFPPYHPIFIELARYKPEEQQIPQPATQPAEVANAEPSKQSKSRLIAHFTDKLKNGFTEKHLDIILCKTLIKNDKGETLKFTLYLLHDVINGLIKAGYFDSGNRDDDFRALQRYLGLPESTNREASRGDKDLKERVEKALKGLTVNPNSDQK